MSDLKPLPCPFCGGAPQSVERPDNIDGTRFFYAQACYCGGYSACAHKMAVEPTPEQAKRTAIEVWNRRAQPAQAGHVPEASCGECGKKASDGWALYCVACMEEAGLPAQAVPLLSDDEIDAIQRQTNASYYAGTLKDRDHSRAIEAAVRAKLGVAVPMPTEDWSVFNTGAEVASGLTWAEAWDYMTPSRIERGWSAVCMADKGNLSGIVGKEGA